MEFLSIALSILLSVQDAEDMFPSVFRVYLVSFLQTWILLLFHLSPHLQNM